MKNQCEDISHYLTFQVFFSFCVVYILQIYPHLFNYYYKILINN